MQHIKMEDLKPGMTIWYGGTSAKLLQVLVARASVSIAIMYERDNGKRFISDTIHAGQEVVLLSPQDLKQLHQVGGE